MGLRLMHGTAVFALVLACLVDGAPAFSADLLTLSGTGYRQSVDSNDPSIVTGIYRFTFAGAAVNDDGSVQGSFIQTLGFCKDAAGQYDPLCATGSVKDLVAISAGDVTCLSSDGAGSIWFAVRFTSIEADPRISNPDFFVQQQAETLAGRHLLVGRISDENGDGVIDHSSLFNDPTLVGLPNLRRAGDVVEITDLKTWETALEGPVTASNACKNQDAYFLRVGSAKVLKGNRLRFIDPLTNNPFGTILDGRFPLPRSPRPWSVVDYSSVNIPVSGALGQTGAVGAVIICPCY